MTHTENGKAPPNNRPPIRSTRFQCDITHALKMVETRLAQIEQLIASGKVRVLPFDTKIRLSFFEQETLGEDATPAKTPCRCQLQPRTPMAPLIAAEAFALEMDATPFAGLVPIQDGPDIVQEVHRRCGR